jgi:hypothetical protein
MRRQLTGAVNLRARDRESRFKHLSSSHGHVAESPLSHLRIPWVLLGELEALGLQVVGGVLVFEESSVGPRGSESPSIRAGREETRSSPSPGSIHV